MVQCVVYVQLRTRCRRVTLTRFPRSFFFFLFLFPFIVNIVVNHDNDNDDNDDASEWGGLVIFSVPTYLEGRGHDSIEVFYYNQYLLTGIVFKIVIL